MCKWVQKEVWDTLGGSNGSGTEPRSPFQDTRLGWVQIEVSTVPSAGLVPVHGRSVSVAISHAEKQGQLGEFPVKYILPIS